MSNRTEWYKGPKGNRTMGRFKWGEGWEDRAEKGMELVNKTTVTWKFTVLESSVQLHICNRSLIIVIQ